MVRAAFKICIQRRKITSSSFYIYSNERKKIIATHTRATHISPVFPYWKKKSNAKASTMQRNQRWIIVVWKTGFAHSQPHRNGFEKAHQWLYFNMNLSIFSNTEFARVLAAMRCALLSIFFLVYIIVKAFYCVHELKFPSLRYKRKQKQQQTSLYPHHRDLNRCKEKEIDFCFSRCS